MYFNQNNIHKINTIRSRQKVDNRKKKIYTVSSNIKLHIPRMEFLTLSCLAQFTNSKPVLIPWFLDLPILVSIDGALTNTISYFTVIVILPSTV